MGDQEYSGASRLLELAERCENATGPDRGLDGDIAVAVGAVPPWATVRPSLQRQPEMFTDGGPGLRARTWLPDKYTHSLDAAMSLAGDPDLNRFGGALGMLREALDRLYRAKLGADALARFVTAAYLRARAAVNGTTTNPYPIPEGE